MRPGAVAPDQAPIQEEIADFIGLPGDGDLTLRPYGLVAKAFAALVHQDGAIGKQSVLGMLPGDQEAADQPAHYRLGEIRRQRTHPARHRPARGEQLLEGLLFGRDDSKKIYLS